ncbi:hypothetical protein ALC53_09294 [Atta colombica]|uniref:Uncharacterized protein n=1 Tax=Atta colombica TaxID=520822 RepID=A0A195B7H8_9HYME|nr:hypothetical protein ALC53_09294 [Atta colombica]
MIRRQRHHGSSAPTHGGRDKGAAHGSFSQFRGVRPERGAVAAQGPPQLSDGGDLRRAASPCRRATAFLLREPSVESGRRAANLGCGESRPGGNQSGKINETLKRRGELRINQYR